MKIQLKYQDGVVRAFAWASIIFGIVALLVGVIIGLQLAFWQANMDTSWLSFGRLRPLHTNAAIFAFVGNMIFAGIYYSTQRLLKVSLSPTLSWLHFWLWQIIIVAAAITLPLGISQAKEYAELEWPIDLLVTVTWVIFAINYFLALIRRREKHLYVALWFYLATVITIAILYIVNNLAIPLNLFKSYSVFSGVQDALVQWWYGHNAVAFFLTTPVLGIMYYFLPKAANRPVFSYRLSIIHFWALVFVYIWAGPHHLLNTALPDWAQSMGMVFSVALWAPSWGGMLNGLLTLRGAWDRVRQEAVLKFFVAALTFYGMATFEGPLLSIKSVSALGHYTDWIIGHVHGGTLGWNGFMAAALFYWLIPKLYRTKLYSNTMADIHFWMGTLGILLYMGSMWFSGISQGLMWRAWSEDGGLLYPNFVETLTSIFPMYMIRALGGTLYLVGFLIMTWNLVKTATSGAAYDEEVEVEDVPAWKNEPGVGLMDILLSKAVLASSVGVALLCVMLYPGAIAYIASLVALSLLGLWAFKGFEQVQGFHRFIEAHPLAMALLTALAVLVGGLVELIPALTLKEAVPLQQDVAQHQRPYTPLELAGRDVYLSEGCYYCHSQMIRPFKDEYVRYGEPSRADEFIYDHPFQWGSKRTGPDLHREGGKRDHLWHYRHFMNPRELSAGSNMPNYHFLATAKSDPELAAGRVAVMKSLGVPYSKEELLNAVQNQKDEAKNHLAKLKSLDASIDLAEDSELLALIAYIQSLGQKATPANNNP
jgi:cytochrome c oxidase cbb3-type subunit I/II